MDKNKLKSVAEIAAVGVLGAAALTHGKVAMKVVGLAATALLAWNAIVTARYVFALPRPST